jgi:hypothetical protein
VSAPKQHQQSIKHLKYELPDGLHGLKALRIWLLMLGQLNAFQLTIL